MMIENILYEIRVWVARLLCKICHKVLATSDFPNSVQDAKAGWQFNNKCKQPEIGGVSGIKISTEDNHD